MTEEKRKPSKIIWKVLFILLNIAVVAYIAISEFGNGIGTDAMPRFCRNWPLYLAGALGCFALLLFAETAKYAYMMKLLGQKVSWRVAFETAALGRYYDCITPSGAGGQPFQIYWLHKSGYSDGASSAMPIAGFITLQTAFALLAVVVFATWRSVELSSIRYTAYVGVLPYLFIPGVLIVFSCRPAAVEKLISGLTHLGARMHIVKNPDGTTGKVVGQLQKYKESLALISGRKMSIVLLMALSLLYHIAYCSIAWFCLSALGGTESFAHVFAATAYVIAAATVIITPGNSGAAEGAFYIVFSAIGSDGIFWAMLIWRLVSYYAFIVVGGGIYGVRALRKRLRASRSKEDSAETA